MGIGKRLLDVARSNATDFASAFTTDPEARERRRLDRELEEELARGVDGSVGAKAGRRARNVADRAEQAWEKAFDEARARGGHSAAGRGVTPRTIEGWYRTLEVPPGADFKVVRKSYRKLVAKYHPDRFASEPDKYAAATEVARKITEAYEGIKILEGEG